MKMKLFAVAIRDYSVAFIDFYWAYSEDDALDKATDDHPTSRIICAAEVEEVEERSPDVIR